MHATRFTRAWLTKLLAAGGALAMLIALVPGTASAQENHRGVPNAVCDEGTPQAAFSDRASADEVHRRSIDCVAAMDIAEGSEGAYWPDAGVTRGQMASFIARTLESAGHELPAPTDQGFEDIAGTEHEARINQLAEIGVVEGRSADRYEPRPHVNRAQMASYIVRAVGWAHGADYGAVGGNHFADAAGNVHAGNISAGYELWLFEGVTPGVYQPDETVERDQMATFLTRALDFAHPNRDTGSNLTYLVTPQEPLEQQPGQTATFEIVQRYDDKPLGPVDIALFPCSLVDGTDLPLTMSDDNGDALADGIAASDTGAAHVSSVNGIPTVDQPGYVNGAQPSAEGTIEFTLDAASSDCTVAVAFGDRAPADQIRLDAADRPANPYGHGVASWGPADGDGGPDAIGEAGTATVQSPDFPSLDGDTALLRDVRSSAHDGFDRVVFEFEGDDVPSHRIGYIDPPVTEDGSGNEVAVEGNAFLEVRATPAAGYDPLSDGAEETYLGPDRFAPAGTAALEELVEVGDFEANLAWVLGVDREADFAVGVLQDPLRIVVDVVHADA
jgi:hypothetical protein